MERIEVEKEKILKVVQKNRDQHRKQYEKALEGFRKKVIANFESRLKQAKEGGKIQLHIGLVEPRDHTDDYDRVLEMLKFEVNDTVELSEYEFANFVQDDWGWKEEFTTTN